MPELDSECPDLYSDLFQLYENPLGVMLVLHKSPVPSNGPPSSSKPNALAILRFSPENWKVILMTGRKQLKTREQTNGTPFKIPAEILGPLGLTEGDW
jgi:hypothetical protein